MVMNDLQALANESGEWLVRGLTAPLIGAILFALGVMLIIGSLAAGEPGIVTGLGAASLTLFYWAHAQVGLAGWEGIVLTGLGLALVALEILILPGFGVAGLLGGGSLLAALIVSVTGGSMATSVAVERALTSVIVAVAALLVGGVLAIRLLPTVARRGDLILRAGGQAGGVADDDQPRLPAAARRAGLWRLAQHLTGEAARGEQRLEAKRRDTLVGERGVALADLRPGGFAQIGGERVDVITRGEVIPAGSLVEVVRDEGYRRIVRRVGPDEPDVATL